MIANMIFSAILSILLGVMMAFWGYPLFRAVLSLFGGMLGAVLLAQVAMQQEHEAAMIIVAGVAGAIIGLVLVNLFYVFGVFWLGAVWGVSLMGSLATAFNASDTLILTGMILFGIIAGGVAALLYERLMIIITTAFIGSGALVVGAATLITGDPDWLYQPMTEAGSGVMVVLACWLIIGLMGVVFQWQSHPENVRVTEGV